jgi:hypothetical protein
MAKRDFRADVLLVMNIRALLSTRRMDAGALAQWCGHKAPWISKIMSLERGVQVKDLGRIADFFGLDVCDLFQRGITPLTERRRAQRWTGASQPGMLAGCIPIRWRIHSSQSPSVSRDYQRSSGASAVRATANLAQQPDRSPTTPASGPQRTTPRGSPLP